MGGLGAVGILRMFDISHLRSHVSTHLREILRHLAPQGHGERLDATADAQHRNLTVIGQTGDQEFCVVALLVDAMQQGRRLLASPEGIEIAATTEDQAVDTLQGVDDDVTVCLGGDDDGHAASRHNGIVITTS